MSDMTGSIEVRGETYEVNFSSWSGQFDTMVNGTRVSSKTWDGLKSAIGAQVRKGDVRVEVPFRSMTNGRTGVAYKMHAKLKKPMIKWDDNGTTETADVGSLLSFDADFEQLQQLRRAAREAKAAVDKFEDDHRDQRSGRYVSSLQTLVQRAIEAKAAEVQAAAEEADTEALTADAVDLDAR